MEMGGTLWKLAEFGRNSGNWWKSLGHPGKRGQLVDRIRMDWTIVESSGNG